ncbi:hypothetical protein EDF57_10640 [Novosphingobium sp. PhB55]|uniref:hypothetical protein n=1 Tax=Novosphingobium sp. PhB55 TaxID=2485106 RepID=UPI001066F363|nr:hypothetical protein [Novosphingobium sp. PhB55]TDW63085.1 hypothetical protein EDF57_10640 [Novosphingobium sp. PhB55]
MIRATRDRLGDHKLEGLAVLVIVVMMAIGSWQLLVAWHDARVIDQHEAKQEAETAKRALTAERTANARAAERSELAHQREEELSDVQSTAEAEDPDGAAGSVGPATRVVVDELRRKQVRPAR